MDSTGVNYDWLLYMDNTIMKILQTIRHPVITFIDWYIWNYHSKKFIHEDMYKPLLQQSLKEQDRAIRDEYERKIERIEQRHAQELKLKDDDYTAKLMWHEHRVEQAENKEKELSNFKTVLESRALDTSTNIAASLHLCRESKGIFAKLIQKFEVMEKNINQISEGVKEENKQYKEIVGK